MSILPGLKKEIASRPDGRFCPDLFRCRGYEGSSAKSNPGIRADGVAAIFETSEPHIYRNDLIAGSILDVFATPGEDELALIDGMMLNYPERGFGKNGDHFAARHLNAHHG